MNVFILDRDPVRAAEMLCDKHVPKMTLETAQILCTVSYIIRQAKILELSDAMLDHGQPLDNSRVSVLERLTKAKEPFKPTHQGHPCVQWVLESKDHWTWLCMHGRALATEHSYRFGTVHSSGEVVWLMADRGHAPEHGEVHWPTFRGTQFCQVMPQQYRQSDPVEAYRNYYIGDKARFAKWVKGRKAPYWWPYPSFQSGGNMCA